MKILYHGTNKPLRELEPKQPFFDLKSNSMKAIFATSYKNFALAMGLTTQKGSSSFKSHDKLKINFVKGEPKMKYVYLHYLPAESFKLIKKGNNSDEWVSYKKVKPIRIEKHSTNRLYNLWRRSNEEELKEFLKNRDRWITPNDNFQKYRRGVFIVVFRKLQDKKIEYLLLKRKLHWKGWEFPKGGVEAKEKLSRTVARECFEETGLKPQRIIKFNVRGKYPYKRVFKDRLGFIGQTYQLFAVGVSPDSKKKVKFDRREHSGFVWIAFKKAIRLVHWGDQKKCLRVVDKFLNKK
ncbi:NUDIX domain-containing protein [Candidatus Pacearchaeota archaeon]|nr:NUDIX domain-containing protein [Candidatus Pacearchaeota archaeon]